MRRALSSPGFLPRALSELEHRGASPKQSTVLEKVRRQRSEVRKADAARKAAESLRGGSYRERAPGFCIGAP